MNTRTFQDLMSSYEHLVSLPNPADDHFYNGLYTRAAPSN